MEYAGKIKLTDFSSIGQLRELPGRLDGDVHLLHLPRPVGVLLGDRAHQTGTEGESGEDRANRAGGDSSSVRIV